MFKNNFREVFTKSTSLSIVHLIDFRPLYQFHLPQSISFFSFIKVHFIHFPHIRVVQKKRPILFLILKLCFTNFFCIFQVVQKKILEILGDSFDTNVDPTGRFTTQQPIKIIEAYFTTKSVLLTQRQYKRDFGRSNVPDRRTIKCLVAKIRETGSIEETPQRPTSFKLLKSNKLGSFSNL